MCYQVNIGAFAMLALVGCASMTSSAEPKTYTLDGDHTHIVWQVDRFGFTNTVGTFSEIKGQLTLDEENPEASEVTAEIALSGLRSDLLEREDIVRGEYWLDEAQYPSITFRSTSVRMVDGEDCEMNCAEVTGEMTLKGVSAGLSFVVQLNKAGQDPVTKADAVGFSASGRFQRSDFGINIANGPIGDEVRFDIEMLAIANQ